MKAFEFGLGIFFLFPSPPPPCPEWGAGGRDRVQMLVGITLSLPQAPLARGMSESMAAVCPLSTEAVRRAWGSPV